VNLRTTIVNCVQDFENTGTSQGMIDDERGMRFKFVRVHAIMPHVNSQQHEIEGSCPPATHGHALQKCGCQPGLISCRAACAESVQYMEVCYGTITDQNKCQVTVSGRVDLRYVVLRAQHRKAHRPQLRRYSHHRPVILLRVIRRCKGTTARVNTQKPQGRR
jgi:hypothetical protein